MDIGELPNYLVRENDGIVFVNFLGLTSKKKPKTMMEAAKDIVSGLADNQEPSIREKALWLAAYADAVTGSRLSKPRFSNRPRRRKSS
jgi:hypothetical protein